jgi:hypothetical protein
MKTSEAKHEAKRPLWNCRLKWEIYMKLGLFGPLF